MQCPSHNKKLEAIPMEEENRKPCQVCGRESTHYCKSCKYAQCSDCRVCSQKHNLIKIIELNVWLLLKHRKSKLNTITMAMPAIHATNPKLSMMMASGIAISAIMISALTVHNDP